MKLESGTYLKTADVKTGESVTFRTEGEWVENTKYTYDDGNPKNDFVIGITYKGDQKRMRLNKTNRDILIAAYGQETQGWIGKSAMIVKEKMLVAGKRMDCITLEIPGQEPKEMTKQEKDAAMEDGGQEIPF